jgi:hypothetical protein
MEGVEEVRQLTDTELQWIAEIAGQRRDWKAEITEQKPDERVAWTSREGATNAGFVREGGFEPPRPFGHRLLRPARLPGSATLALGEFRLVCTLCGPKA